MYTGQQCRYSGPPFPPAVVEGAISDKIEDVKPRRAYSSATTSYQIKIDGPPRWKTRKRARDLTDCRTNDAPL